MIATPYVTGLVLALVTALLLRAAHFDRDRAVYPVVVIVNASYYVLFAVMGGSTRALLVESSVTIAFVIVAIVGFRFNSWLVVAGLAGHGVLDFFHQRVVDNPGVPDWWPAFCMTFDVAIAAALAVLIARGLYARPERILTETATIARPGLYLRSRTNDTP